MTINNLKAQVESALCRPWAILPARLRSVVESAPSGPQEEQRDEYSITSVEGGIGTIYVRGVLFYGAPDWAQDYGYLNTAKVRSAVRELDFDESVRAIILNIDSPGGIVTGTAEAADAIYSASKPTFAFTESMMDSAAYWIGSAAQRVYATRMSDIGSIGVYVPFYDMRRMFEREGIDAELFTSGELKGAGVPGISLTDPQRADIQAGVDEVFDEFKAAVWRTRPDVDDSMMTGGTYTGSRALAGGLIDSIVGGIEDVIGEASAVVG